MSKTSRILLIPGHGVGDCICFAAAIRTLKQCYPNILLDVLAYRTVTQDIFAHNPDIQDIIRSPSDAEIAKMRTQYDHILCFPFIDENFTWIKKLNIKAYLPSCGDEPHAEVVLSLIKKHFPKCRAANIPHYPIYPQPQHFAEAEKILRNKGADLSGKEILIGCHIGYSSIAYRNKCRRKFFKKKYGRRVWPPDNYVKLLKTLIKKNKNIRFVLSGKLAEQALIRTLFKRHSVHIYDISGETSILTLAAMMRSFQCFVSADTGPMHLAVAMDTPLVALFSDKTYHMGQPYPPQAHHHSLVKAKTEDISVQEVADLIMHVIGATHA